MIPNLSLSASAKSDAQGGTQGVTNNVLHEGDWNTTTGSGSNGMSTKTMMYIAAAGAVLWFLNKQKAA
jgi:hypothetical protein